VYLGTLHMTLRAKPFNTINTNIIKSTMPSASTKLPTSSGGGKRSSVNTNNNDNNNDSDSDESAVIVWEDNTSNVDFRHYLLNDANANGTEGGSAYYHGGKFSYDDDCDNDGGGAENGADRRGSSRRLTLPVAMTQQIEDMSSGSSSSEDENDNDKQTDKKIRHGRTGRRSVGGKAARGVMADGNEAMTPPPNNSHRCPQHPAQLSSSIISGGGGIAEHGDHHDAMNAMNQVTTVATTSLAPITAPEGKLKRRKSKRNLMNDAGDIPATISKLRRQQHGTRGSCEQLTTAMTMPPSHLSPSPPSTTTLAITTTSTAATTALTTDPNTIPHQVMEKENQPPPQKPIEEREGADEQSATCKIEVCHHDDDIITACDELLSKDTTSSEPHILTNGNERLPLPLTTDIAMTDSRVAALIIKKPHTHQQHDLSVSSQYDHTNLHHELQHLQQPLSLTKSTTTNNSVDNGCRDLFREIELGLDRVCAASVDTNETVNGKLESNVISKTLCSKATATAIHASTTPNNTSPTEGIIGKFEHGVDLGNGIEDNEDDEVWNDDDLAAIDLSVAMVANLNRPTSQQQECVSSCACVVPSLLSDSSLLVQQRSPILPSDPLQGSASEGKGYCQKQPTHESHCVDTECGMDDDDDDDLWNDEDLAAIDLSVATLARSSLNTITSRTTEDGAINQNELITSDDDDQDFAEIDFNALDDTIERHFQSRQQLLTQEKQFDNMQSSVPLHFSPPLPPPLEPIFNRRRNHNSIVNHNQERSSTLPPSYLTFTRYTVQIVHEDLLTYTKTIGVSLWNISQNEKKQSVGADMDELMSMCVDQSKSNDMQNSVCGNAIDGYLHLRGEWYHTSCHPGDIIHLCSLSGDYLTDITALPVVLHSDPPPNSDPCDDLLLVLHPDELISPTLVSEAVQCPRLAVLRSRLGSTGMSSRSAVIGILRHELFERCLREKDASHKSAALFTRQIIRKNANALLGCGVFDQRAAFGEVIKTLSQIQLFLGSFTSWNATKPNMFPPLKQKDKHLQLNGTRGGGAGCISTPKTLLKGMFASCDTLMELKDVYSTEQWMHVPELGLKGNVDATVMARMKSLNSLNITSHGDTQDVLLPVELKTGHAQSPNHNHLAQLSIYTMMLRAKQGSCNSFVQSRTQNNDLEVEALGAASSGMLLYLNHESYCARHVKPTLNDVKTLMGQRNKFASNVIRAARPRGIAIEYESEESNRNETGKGQRHGRGRVVVKEGIAPSSALPELQPNVNSCERCYKNRECMMYASADIHSNDASSHTLTLSGNSSHKRLLDHFTSHLHGADLEYFCKWDMLIDLERHASSKNLLSSWLHESSKKETKDGKCISSLVLAEFVTDAGVIVDIDGGEEGDTLIRFARSDDSAHTTPLSNLNFEVGSHAIISEDATFASKSENDQQMGAGRHEMHILRGAVVRIGEHDIDVAVPSKDIDRFKLLAKWDDGSAPRNPMISQRTSIHSNMATKKKFRLDKDDFVGLFGLLLQNIVNFFTLNIPPFSAESLGTPVKTKSLTANTELSDRRRRLNSCIVQLKPSPRFFSVSLESIFSGESDVDVPGCDQNSIRRDFERLNSDQQAAVLKVIAAEDFALIQGLPGTGKTETISFITRLLVMRGKRVLLTSYTHSAVDNLLCKLMESGLTQEFTSQKSSLNPIIRIGQVSSCHPQVRPILAHSVASEIERFDSIDTTTSIEQPSVDYLHKVISEAKVVGVSALTAPRSPLLAGQHFDVVIVDEAGQISQPAILGAIMTADSFVLVGDHMQLPPLVISEVAEEGGTSLSLNHSFVSLLPSLTRHHTNNSFACCTRRDRIRHIYAEALG
jgi:hypothetical protein